MSFEPQGDARQLFVELYRQLGLEALRGHVRIGADFQDGRLQDRVRLTEFRIPGELADLPRIPIAASPRARTTLEHLAYLLDLDTGTASLAAEYENGNLKNHDRTVEVSFAPASAPAR